MTSLAGMLVFFLIMSLVPLLFWLTLLFGETGAVLDRLLELRLFDWARSLILYLKENAQGAASGASVFLIATTLWSGSAFFYHARRSGEMVYGAARPHKGWKVRLGAVFMTLGVLFFFAAAGAALVAAGFVVRRLPAWAAYAAVYALLLVLGFFAAWIMNVYICPYAHSAARLTRGSLLTAAAWLIASAAFSVYLSFSDREQLYGALALVIVFLLWMYWMMICFLSGVVYNKSRLHRLRGS